MREKQGKIIVITGASSGIGKELRKQLAASGNTVVNISRRALGADDLSYSVDLASGESAIAATIAAIGYRFGRIDVLICNAGYGLSGPVEHISETEITRIMDVNLMGAVWCTRACIRYMPRGGRVLYVSSVSGIIPMPYRTMYNVSKAALTEFGMSMSAELKPLGISVTTLLVAAVDTRFAEHRSKFVTTDRRYAGAVAACDDFVDSKGGKSATGKLSSQSAATKIAKTIRLRRPPLRRLIATVPYHVAYPLALLFPSATSRIVAKIFMGKSYK